MKIYGLQFMYFDIDYADLSDSKEYGLKSSSVNLPSKCGDVKNTFRNSKLKHITRIRYKRLARQYAKNEIKSLIDYKY